MRSQLTLLARLADRGWCGGAVSAAALLLPVVPGSGVALCRAGVGACSQCDMVSLHTTAILAALAAVWVSASCVDRMHGHSRLLSTADHGFLLPPLPAASGRPVPAVGAGA